MKKLIPALFTLLVSIQGIAQTSSFSGATGLVTIPCLIAYQNGNPILGNGGQQLMYQVQLKTTDSKQFSLASLTGINSSEECSASFDLGTNVYTDLVNLNDNAYQITMNRGANGTFTLQSYSPAGLANTTLWTISNGVNTVYLGGTVHILSDADYPLPRAFNEAYNKTSVLYFELDFDDPKETGAGLTTTELQALLKDPEGKTLDQVLSPSTYGALSLYLRQKNLSLAAVQGWSAQMLVNTLNSLEITQSNYSSDKGVDRFFSDKAIQDQKPIFGLETFNSQISMLQTMDEGAEDKLVQDALAAYAEGSTADDATDLITAWRTGDGTAVAKTFEKLRIENPRNYNLLLTIRNKAWLSKIDELLATKEVELILVGAAHLPGLDGLLTLLRSRGYTVKKY